MGTKTDTGFTVIETMLFLAVTGALAVGILVGSGVSIGQQRYRDSVNGLKSYIQQQYSEVSNVVNSRDKTWACDAQGNVVEVEQISAEARGTSDCVVLGRFITINDTGTTISASNVIGNRSSGGAVGVSDIDEITSNYRLAVSPVDVDSAEISWGAQVVKPNTATPMPLSILIIRSPLSGSILTFTQEGIQSDLESMVEIGNMNQAQDLCVNADAGSFVGSRLEVKIDAYASSQTAIQIPVESSSVCD